MAWTELTQLLLPVTEDAPLADTPMLSRTAFAQAALLASGTLAARAPQRVALWYEDAASLAIALFACWRAGVQAVLPGDVQPSHCENLDVDAWLSDVSLSLPAGKLWHLQDLCEHPPLAAVELNPAQSLVLCTSGSSGAPKQLHKTWGQLTEEVRALQQQWPDLAGPVLGSVSAQHMFGLPFRILWPLCAGQQIDRRQRLYPEELQQVSLQYPAFTWISSPALLRRLGARLDSEQLQGRLKRIFSSGGALPAEVSREVELTLGLAPLEIYGSSETGAVAWRSRHADWRALPGLQLSAGDSQALRVSGPWIHQEHEQTADAVCLTPDGFQLLGRLDRIIKIEEKRISLPMIEQAILTHDCVIDVRVGRASEAQRLTGLVALSPLGLHRLRNEGRKALVDSLRTHLIDKVPPLALPRSWRLFQHLPVNAQGKLPQSDFDTAAGPRPLMPPVQALPCDLDVQRNYRLDIPYDLAHFSGHFPSAPVVPGVAQIGWVMALAQRDLYAGLRFGGMEALKFQSLLRPGDCAELMLRWDAAKQKLHFNCTVNGKSCSTGRILQTSQS